MYPHLRLYVNSIGHVQDMFTSMVVALQILSKRDKLAQDLRPICEGIQFGLSIDYINRCMRMCICTKGIVYDVVGMYGKMIIMRQ